MIRVGTSQIDVTNKNSEVPLLTQISKRFVSQYKSWRVGSRKGMLLVSETLKLVIAVICIGFLVYLLASLYFSGGEEQNKQDATSLLLRMEGIASEMVEGNSSDLNSITPGGWSVFSYAGQEQRPNDCSGESCVCICYNVFGDVLNRQLNECSSNGVCFVESDLLPNLEIEIVNDGSTNIQIYRTGGRLGVKEI